MLIPKNYSYKITTTASQKIKRGFLKGPIQKNCHEGMIIEIDKIQFQFALFLYFNGK